MCKVHNTRIRVKPNKFNQNALYKNQNSTKTHYSIIIKPKRIRLTHYIIIQLLFFMSPSQYFFIYERMLPSYLENLFLFDSHLSIIYTMISLIVITIGLTLAPTKIELNACNILLNKVSHLEPFVDLYFLQNLGGILVGV